MPVYTVHEPPKRNDDDTLAHTSRFVFVRDGFHVWAFLLAPLWMLRHRLWIELIVYALVIAAISVGLRRLGIVESAGPVAVLLSLLVGMEASTLRRWKLARRRYVNLGVVVGADLEDAERRFFDGWTGPPESAPPPVPQAPTSFLHPASSEIVGLFPQPGARS